MGCTVMVATRAALLNMLKGTSTSTPRIGYALTARTRCPSSEVFVDVGNGGRGALRSSTMAKPPRRLGLEAPAAGGPHPTSDGGNVDTVDAQEEVDEEMGVPSWWLPPLPRQWQWTWTSRKLCPPTSLRQQSHLGSRQKHIQGKPSGTLLNTAPW